MNFLVNHGLRGVLVKSGLTEQTEGKGATDPISKGSGRVGFSQSSEPERVSSESKRILVLIGVESPIRSEIGSRSGTDSDTKSADEIDVVVETEGEVRTAPWLS